MQEKTNTETEQTLEEIEQSLLDKGLRFTAPRRRVMAALLETEDPAKAYDLVETIGDIKPMTVYRALDFLVETGLAHRIESLNAFAPCAQSHCHHTDSQYLICEECGKTQELHNHAIDDFIKSEIQKTGFVLKSKNIELRGSCTDCQ